MITITHVRRSADTAIGATRTALLPRSGSDGPSDWTALEDDGAAVGDRHVRHTALMTEHTPRYVVIQTEGALRFRVGSAELMREQLEVCCEHGL